MGVALHGMWDTSNANDMEGGKFTQIELSCKGFKC